MSHDKKKSKKTVEGTRMPVETVLDTSKGAANNIQKGSGDAKTRVKNSVPDKNITSKKASKSKKR
jgi:hypothetical protein